VLMGGFDRGDAPKTAQAIAGQAANTKELGKLMYTQYLYPLEVAAVLLLVAIIAAIALTMRERKDSKYVDPSMQVRVKARDRMQVIKMDATKNAAAPAIDTEATEATASQSAGAASAVAQGAKA
jgi:NADH-quinone oxidoreductase subunit J